MALSRRQLWNGIKTIFDWVTGATASKPKVMAVGSDGNELFTAAKPGNVQVSGCNVTH